MAVDAIRTGRVTSSSTRRRAPERGATAPGSAGRSRASPASRPLPEPASPSTRLVNAREEIAHSLQERIERETASCVASAARSASARTRCSGSTRAARRRYPRPVLHARGAWASAAAADERLRRRGRRARVPDRPGRSWYARSARSSRATGCTCSARSETASTSMRGGCSSSAAGSDRAAAVPLSTARRATRDPRLPQRQWHAEAAALLPQAEVCIEPTYVTALLHGEPHDVLACGPELMLQALHGLVTSHGERRAQLAEAPMAWRLWRLARLRG